MRRLVAYGSALGASLWGVILGAALQAQEPGPASVKGIVRDAAGQPIDGALVVLSVPGNPPLAQSLTAGTGRFEFTVPAGGPYTVTVRSPNHSPAVRGALRFVAGEKRVLAFELAGGPIRLPAVEIVSAMPQPLEAIPGSTHVVDREALESSRPVSVGEVLRDSPGLSFKDEDRFGLVLNIGVRGLDPRRSSRVLLLEDGMPIHLGPYGDPTARYHPPLATVQRIEVLKGSGQILHGPHTVGGVVNFVTSPPPSKPGGSVALSGGSRDFVSGHVRFGGMWGDRGVAIDYVHEAGDGIRRFDRHLVNHVVVKGVLGLGARQSVSLKGSYFRDDSHTGESALTQEEFEADPFQNPFRHNAYLMRRGMAQVVHAIELGQGAALTTNLYGQRTRFTTFRQAGSSADRFGQPDYADEFGCPPDATGPDDCGNQGRPRTYTFGGIEPRLSAAFRHFGMESYLDVGARAHIERVDREQFAGERANSRSGELVRNDQIRTEAFALFAQNRFVLGPWSLVPGLRLERLQSRNENQIDDIAFEDDHTKLLPGAGITFNGVGNVTLFAGAHRGFAPPRPAEVLNPRPGAALLRVNPEVSWNYEAGIRALPAPWIHAEATFFRIDFENQVVRGDLVNSGQTLVNGGETLNQGIELSAGVDLAPLLGTTYALYARGAYTSLVTADFRGDRVSSVDGETPIEGNRLPYAPEHLFSGTVGYVFPAGFELRVDADHVSDQFGDDLNTVTGSENGQRGLIPAYTIWSAGASYHVPAWRATLSIDVKNFTDELYITDRQEGLVVGAPRFIVAGVRWTF